MSPDPGRPAGVLKPWQRRLYGLLLVPLGLIAANSIFIAAFTRETTFFYAMLLLHLVLGVLIAVPFFVFAVTQITALTAHAFGLAWYEQYREAGAIKFREHILMNKEAKDNAYGVKFSEIHAIALVDMDGDGLKDLVTGKRFWSHGRTGDPDRNDAAGSRHQRGLQGT